MASPGPTLGKMTGYVFVNEQRHVALKTYTENFWLPEQLGPVVVKALRY
jgi:hypothetical protein